MLDAVSLDQLRTFIAAVDEGSFSAASRKLLRSQSVVSETISNLEQQIGVQLFDRSGRYPKLTAAGSVILGDARSIITGVDLLKARAKGMSAGLEPELSVVNRRGYSSGQGVSAEIPGCGAPHLCRGARRIH